MHDSHTLNTDSPVNKVDSPKLNNINLTTGEASTLSTRFASQQQLAKAVEQALKPITIPRINTNSPENAPNLSQPVSISPAINQDTFTVPPATPANAPALDEATIVRLQSEIEKSVVDLEVLGAAGKTMGVGSAAIVGIDEQRNKGLMVTSIHNIEELLGLRDNADPDNPDFMKRAQAELRRLLTQNNGKLPGSFQINGEAVEMRIIEVADEAGGEQLVLEFDIPRGKKPSDYQALQIDSGSNIEVYGTNNTRHYGLSGYSGKGREFGIDPFVAVTDVNSRVIGDEATNDGRPSRIYQNLVEAQNASIDPGDSGGLLFSYFWDAQSGTYEVRHNGTITARGLKGENRGFITKNSDKIVDAVNDWLRKS